MKYIAYTTKGLEQVSVEEIKHFLENVEIGEVKAKRVVFGTTSNLSKLTQIRTVDDLGIFIGKTEAQNLEEVISFAETLDFGKSLSLIKQIRNAGDRFSITATLAGVRGYKGLELVKELSKIFAQKTGWKFSEAERSAFDIRIFIDRKEVYFSVRLTEKSLHDRKYKNASKEGSLKPTIAAVMVQLVNGWKTNLKVVDNFCGSGTILAEALLAGNQVFGSDIDPESVQITVKNLSNLIYEAKGKIKVQNATHTNWPNHFFDYAISNLPWGKQVEITSITNLYAGALKEYQRILKLNAKLCLIVSNPELLIKHAKLNFPNAKITTIKIGYLGQNPTIVVVG